MACVGCELAAARLGDGVELGLAIVARGAPFGLDPAALFETNEGGVDGALIEKNFVSADLLNAACDAVAVERAHGGEGLQDHEVESALQEVEFAWVDQRIPFSLWRYHMRIVQNLWGIPQEGWEM